MFTFVDLRVLVVNRLGLPLLFCLRRPDVSKLRQESTKMGSDLFWD